ncbi:MAG: ABC transporter permease [Thermoanaerobaculia bacterium]|nr:ABC transporter permease [Thermoanaerobaculia bacterium]
MVQSFGRIVAIARKEIRQLRRDRLTFGMVVAIPIIQLLLFGFAINQDIRHLRAGVADLSGSQQSRRLLTDAEASQVIDIVARVASIEELNTLLRQGHIAVGVVIPPDFEQRVERSQRAQRGNGYGPGGDHLDEPLAQLLVDASDPASYGAAAGLRSLPIAPRSGLKPRASAATFEMRPYYNPERRTAVQIVPGLVGVILTMTMVLFTSVAIVRERERGNLELLITTPLSPIELMVGKILPYIVIGCIQLLLVLSVGRLLFDVPLRGQPLDVLISSLVFIFASLSLGLVISTVAQTQFQAFQLTFFTFLPQILLSGFMFPFDAMPEPAQWIAEVMPLTHFLRVIRGIVLRGASLSDISRDLWPLLAFGAIAMTLASLRFRKRLD